MELENLRSVDRVASRRADAIKAFEQTAKDLKLNQGAGHSTPDRTLPHYVPWDAAMIDAVHKAICGELARRIADAEGELIGYGVSLTPYIKPKA